MGQEDGVYTHNGILVIKKHEIMSFAATWVDLEIILSEECQRKRQANIT